MARKRVDPREPENSLTADAVHTHLPLPKHPFAAWAGTAATGICALGAQSLRDPFKQLVALVSPGAGYLAGHGIDQIIAFISKQKDVQKRDETLRDSDVQLGILTKERAEYIRVGAPQELIEQIDTQINSVRKRRIAAMSSPQ